MVLVTGATGHIGNVLVRELIKRGISVRVILHKDNTRSLDGLKYEAVLGDIRDKEFLQRAFEGVDKVYHLAAKITILPKYEKDLEDINVNGTKNIAEFCVEKKIKLIYVSSVHAIADIEHGTPIDETTAIDPALALGDYGKSKAKATNIVLDLIKNKGLNAVIVHPAGVIGPFDYRGSQMGITFKAMMTWMFLGMKGEYNFVDVRDVVSAIILADEKAKNGERYILSGHIIPVAEMKKTIDKVMNRPHWYIAMPSFLARLGASIMEPLYKPFKITPILTHESLDILNSNPDLRNTKAIKKLGWNVRSFESTMKDTIPWLKNSSNLWKN